MQNNEFKIVRIKNRICYCFDDIIKLEFNLVLIIF